MNGPDNAIGWCDYTWNPVTGCKHGCTFGPEKTPCYAEVIAERFRGSKAFPKGFEPMYHPARLIEPRKVKNPARIFTCSMADLFGAWVPFEWIHSVLSVAAECPWHSFQFLTKAPWVAQKYSFPDNAWLGATITGGLSHEAVRLKMVRDYPARIRFLSVEPLEGPLDISLARPDWVIIGAATGKGAFQPKAEWREPIEDFCTRQGIPIFHKDNLVVKTRRMEFPSVYGSASSLFD